MYYNTEASKRLIHMDPSCSQSTFLDSTRNALQAQKQNDGSLRITTPFQERQTQKVANLKQKLTQLNMSSSVRCQSNLHNSSQASVTAATSYLPKGAGVDQSMKQGGYPYRPNSNISNIMDSRNNLDRQKTFITDLTRFSQNSISKDLSPLRTSHLKNQSKNQQVLKNKNYAHSTMQDPRKQTKGLGCDTSPMQRQKNLQKYKQTAARNFEHITRSRNSGSARRGGGVSKHSSNGGGTRSTICRSASFPRATSIQSMRTNQSSPERLVNIVCPPSRGQKNRRNGQQIVPKGVGGTAKVTRPRSDMRHSLHSNSFVVTDRDQKKETASKQKLIKQLQALGNQHGLNGLSASSQSQFMSTKRLGNQLSKKAIVTPQRSRKDSQHLAEESRQKSRSHSRLELCKSANNCSTPGLSTKKRKNKHSSKKGAKLSNADKRKLVQSRISISRNSMRSKSAQSSHRRSSNSNKKEPSESMKNRDERRLNKYLRNQKQTSSIKKQFNFASIEAQNSIDQSLNEPQMFAKPPSGQITGKFRSLNEPILNQMAAFRQKENILKYTGGSLGQSVAFADHKRHLHTEDDYCETLTETASSEDSPMRPSVRVQRAAALTTKAYLDEVNHRLQNANEHAQSVKEFGPRKMKAAYQQINMRQGARLQNLKQQMQESLIETHQLQAKLQNSSTFEEDAHKAHRQGVSQFNNLVLEFSQNLENRATEMIEATESKRRNAKMREMISELQEMRDIRSGSKSVPTSARRHRSSLPMSNQKSARKHGRSRSKSSAKSDRSGSLSARSNRSRRSSTKKSNRKRSKSQKSARRLKLGSTKRSKSKKSVRSRGKSSARSTRSLSKSARSGRSATSAVSSRGRSRSRKKIKSVKRNIFKQTNGFRDIEQTIQNIRSRPLRSKSRQSKKARSKSVKSRSKSVKSRNTGRSISGKPYSRIKQLAKKCDRLIGKKFKGLDQKQKKVKRSISKNKRSARNSKVSKSRSKSMRKGVSIPKSKSRSKSTKKRRQGSTGKSPINMVRRQEDEANMKGTPNLTPQITPCMTPLHKILRNSMGDQEASEMAARGAQMGRFGSMAQPNKKVKICSRRLQDITQLTSSDSDSSYDSEDSMDNERYLKRQQAHLSPWQRACIRKQLPKKFR